MGVLQVIRLLERTLTASVERAGARRTTPALVGPRVALPPPGGRASPEGAAPTVAGPRPDAP